VGILVSTEDLVVRELLVVDIYERESRVLDALLKLRVRFVRRALRLGDYEVGGVLVERKTVLDLHLSIINRRLWRQVARMQSNSAHPYLLVEGADLDSGPLRPESVRGAFLALAEIGVPVIRTTAPDDTALWLKLLVDRDQRRARRYTPPRPRTATDSEAVLCAVPGISLITARALLTRYKTVAQVASSDPSEWLSVPGIGPVRQQSLYNALRQSPATAT
jgi:ERCC4-type nuclease